jgi:hypothetical protein
VRAIRAVDMVGKGPLLVSCVASVGAECDKSERIRATHVRFGLCCDS